MIKKFLILNLSGFLISTSALNFTNSQLSKTSLIKNADNKTNYSSQTTPTMDRTLEKLDEWYDAIPEDKIDDYKNKISNIYQINTSYSSTTDSSSTYNVSVDKDLVSEYLNDNIINTDVSNLLTSDTYEKNINQEINDEKQDCLTISDNKLVFNGDQDNNAIVESQSNDKGVWTISHWYWMGYWKLCFGEDVTTQINNILTGGGDETTILNWILAASFFEDIPILGEIVDALAAFIFLCSTLLFSKDKGAGVYIGFWAIAPCYFGVLVNNLDLKGFYDYCGGWGYQKQSTHTILLANYKNYYNYQDYLAKVGAFIFKDFICEIGAGSNPNSLHHPTKWNDPNFGDITYFDKLQFNNNQKIIDYHYKYFLCKQDGDMELNIINDTAHKKINLVINDYVHGTDSFKKVSAVFEYEKIEYFKRYE